MYKCLHQYKQFTEDKVFGMTVIEFFDRTPVENIISCLSMRPNKVILAGGSSDMSEHGRILKRVAAAHGLDIEISCVPVDRNNLTNAVSCLCGIIESEPGDFSIDLTGGEDLLLVAAGIVAERYAKNGGRHIELHHYNVRTGAVQDCDNNNKVFNNTNPKLSIVDDIVLHGGKLRYSNSVLGDGTYRMSLSDDFAEDVNSMWDLCRTDPAQWNMNLNALELLSHYKMQDDDPLDFFLTFRYAEEHIPNCTEKLNRVCRLAEELGRRGIIEKLRVDSGLLAFRYKNAQIKRCLAKAGSVLEIKMLLLANSALDDDGNQYYNDAASGVTIVWSNHGSSVRRWNFYDESTDYCDINTENEIDVMLMRGVIPVFVSCKNGAVDSNELYKLNTVADRFGSIYAKKIIAATYLGKMGSGREMDPFRRRAEEMGIELIENAHLMNDDELLARLKKATE